MDINTKIEVTPPVIRGKPRVVYAVDGLSAYEIAVKHGFEGTEEQWLNSIVRGEPGYTPQPGVDYFNGYTPFIGENGNWCINENETDVIDTGVKAKGEDGENGVTPKFRINTNNLWEVSYDNGETWKSTGTKATGEDGKDGENGGAFYNDAIPFNQDNPTLGVAYTVRPEKYPLVDFSNYKKGNVYSRQWNNADGTTRKGTALLKYEGAANADYSFTLISLISDGNSAYDVAVANGYKGSEEDWVNENIYPKFYQDDVLVKKVTFRVSGDTLSIDTET